MEDDNKAPRYSYFIVLGAAFLALALFFLTLFIFEIRGSYPAILAAGECFALGAMVALIWPTRSWRWGLWVSSGFYLFFCFVFISFMLKGQVEWLPIIEAVVVAALACLGGLLGARHSDRVRRTNAEC